MIFYLIYFILLISAFSFTFNKKCSTILNDSRRRRQLLWVLFLIIIFGGLRYKTGTDWPGYEGKFTDAVRSTSFYLADYDVELGYSLLNYYFAHICAQYVLFQLFIFSIALILKFYFFKNNKNLNIYFALLIYFSTIFLIFDINGVRQGIALGITLVSTIYIFKRKIVYFSLLIILAFLFHKSSIVFFPFYFIYNIKYNFSIIQYSLLTIAFIALGLLISKYTSEILLLIAKDELTERFDYYAESSLYTTKVTLWGLASLRRYFVWSFILITLRNNNKPELLFYKNCMLVSFLLFFSMSASMEISYRLSYYLYAYEMVLVPYAVCSIKNSNIRIICIWGLLVYYFYMMFKLVSNPLGGLNDYQNYLFQII